MNIFVLDLNPKLAAQYHCDKHVVKMVLETAQILSTVHHNVDGQQVFGSYKPTHKNHPCVVWAGKSVANYRWLHELGLQLSLEYTHRYGKVHKSVGVIHLLKDPPDKLVTCDVLTPFALAMPEKYRSNDPVRSYRAYYLGEKLGMLDYKNRNVPSWVIEGLELEILSVFT